MGRPERFVQALRERCGDDSCGYSQTNRWGPDFDCSSLMIQCAADAGYDVPTGWGSTHTMCDTFVRAGWRAVEYWDQDLWSIPGGCVMLNCANHTEGVIDFGIWGGAHIDEHGGVTGCCTGDQTGNEVSVCSPYHYGSYPNDWDYVLVPSEVDWAGLGTAVGAASSETTCEDGGWHDGFSRADGERGAGVCYEVHTDAGWLGHVTSCDDSELGYAGFEEMPIDGIRAYRMDGERLAIQTIMDDGTEWSETNFYGTLRGSNAEGDGYAGDIGSGHYITGLRVFGAEVRVAVAGNPWLGWSCAMNPTPEGDDFAGEDLDKKLPIVAVQMRV